MPGNDLSDIGGALEVDLGDLGGELVDAPVMGALTRNKQPGLMTQIGQGAQQAFESLTPALPFVRPGLQATAKAGQGMAELGGLVGPKTRRAAEFVFPQTEGQAAVAVAGEVAGPMIAARMAPYAVRGVTKISESAKNLIAIAEKYGIKLSPADILRSRRAIDVEGKLARLPGSGGMMADFIDNQYKAVKELGESILSKTGDDIGRREVGEALDFGRKEVSDTLFKIKNEAYEKASEVVKPDLTAGIGRLHKQAEQLRKQGKFGPDVEAKIEQILSSKDPSGLTKGTAPSMRFDELAAFRSDVGSKLTPGRMGEKFLNKRDEFAMRRLFAAADIVEENFAKAAGGEEMVAALRSARELDKAGRRVANQKAIRGIRLAMREEGGAGAEAAYRAATASPAAIRQIKNGVSVDALQKLQRRFVQEAFEVGGEELANPKAVSKFIEKNKAIAAELLPRETLTALMDFSSLAKGVGAAQRAPGAQGSAGVNALVALLAGGGTALANPAAGVGVAVGTYAAPFAFAKFYLSPIGRKLAIEGVRIPAGTPQAAQWATRAMAFGVKEGIFPSEVK